MYCLSDLRIFEEIIFQSRNKKIILYGLDNYSNKIGEMLDLLGVNIAYYIDSSIKNQYDLLYEDIDKIYIIIPQEKETALINKKELIGIMGRENTDKCCITLYNDGEHTEWDTIDINLGFIQKRQFYEFKTSNKELKDYYTIVTLGGSTTYWDYMWRNKSWSEQLRDEFEANGKEVRILCGGMQGYSSSQELIKFIRDVPNLNPDMVISFGGVNDVRRVEEAIDYPFAFEHSIILLNDMKELYGDNMKNISYGIKNMKSNAQHWLENIQIMNEIAKIYNIKFYAFLQPMINIGKYCCSLEEKYALSIDKRAVVRDFLQGKQAFYEYVENNLEDKNYIINLKDIFAGEKEIYYDHCHVYEKGNTIIAKNIYQYISKYIN